MFKKTLLSAVILGLASSANAAMYVAPKCEAGNVTVPCEGNAWDIGIDALYLRNNESVMSDRTVTDADNTAFRGDYGWGFRLEGSYHFGTGHDFSVNWAHYAKTTDATVGDAFNGFDVGTTDGSLENKFDIVNFELGQHIDVGEHWDMRVHGGFQYATIKQDAAVAQAVNAGFLVDSTLNRKLRGFGVRAGVDNAYDFGNGFALFANGAVTILNSKLTDSTDNLVIDNTIGDGVFAGFNEGDFHSTTTATDMRVGAKYTHAMAQGDLTIHGGYQAYNYINGSFARDIDYSGWFVGAKWVGNA